MGFGNARADHEGALRRLEIRVRKQDCRHRAKAPARAAYTGLDSLDVPVVFSSAMPPDLSLRELSDEELSEVLHGFAPLAHKFQ